MNDFDLQPAADLGLPPYGRLRSVRREVGLLGSAGHVAWAAAARLYLGVWHRLRVEGAEHLPAEPPFVLCGNHTSHLDALALAAPLPFAVRHRVFALAAGDVFFERPAAVAFAAGLLNALPVWRERSSPRALAELREKLLGTGCGYILFPEGTRSRDGTMTAFKPGVGMLVAGTPVPVIPCHLSGAFAACPPGRRFPRRVPLALRVGPPVRFPDAPPGRAGWEQVAAEVERRVRALAPPDREREHPP